MTKLCQSKIVYSSEIRILKQRKQHFLAEYIQCAEIRRGIEQLTPKSQKLAT